MHFSDSQLNKIIENSPQKHKEAGFSKGWASRFDTWYKLCKEFGFIYYEMNKKIEISSSGHMLCDAYLDNSENSVDKIQRIFLNALAKYQTDNPFRKNANNNAPIPLLLNVLKILNEDENSSGIHRKELPFLMCWKNNDYESLYEFIISFRKKYGFKASDEIVYEQCLKLLESENTKRFKMSQIINEGVDDLIRKLRMTGIFSLRGMGRFIDVNKLEINTANYIIDEYTNYKTFHNKYDFYKYMGDLDPNLIKFREIKFEDLDNIRVNTLKKFSKIYSSSQVFKEINNLQLNRASKDEYLKLIESPTRLEFLTSIAIMQKFPNYEIKPNYAVDDEGNPTFTAAGGLSDIEVYDADMDSLIEVTLMKSRQQATNEIPAITRHLKEQREKSTKENVFSVFIAPHLHEDTIFMCQFTMYRDRLGIYPYSIVDFIDKLKTSSSLLEMKYNV